MKKKEQIKQLTAANEVLAKKVSSLVKSSALLSNNYISMINEIKRVNIRALKTNDANMQLLGANDELTQSNKEFQAEIKGLESYKKVYLNFKRESLNQDTEIAILNKKLNEAINLAEEAKRIRTIVIDLTMEELSVVSQLSYEERTRTRSANAFPTKLSLIIDKLEEELNRKMKIEIQKAGARCGGNYPSFLAGFSALEFFNNSDSNPKRIVDGIINDIIRKEKQQDEHKDKR